MYAEGSMQRTSGWFPAVLAAVLFAVVLLTSGGAAAQPGAPAVTTEQCVAAHLENQKMRNQGQLAAAKADLLVCVQEGCPPPIRTECAGWLTELDAQMPSVVVAAVDAAGKDTAEVIVSIDGVKVAERLDGRPLAIDPGNHQITCEHRGESRTENVVVVQGEKSRAIRCSFAVDVGPASPPPAEEGPATAQLVAGVVIGVLGLGGIASFAVLGSIGTSEASDLDGSCGANAPPPLSQTCTDEQIDPVHKKLVAADVSLGIGAGLMAVSLGLIVHYLVTLPEEEGVAVRVDLGPTIGGAAGQLTVSF